MRSVLLALVLLLVAWPAQAQPWRPFEVSVPEGALNDAIDRQQDAARRAARRAPPEPPAESVGEAFSRLARSLAEVTGARVRLRPGRILLEAHVRVFALTHFTHVQLQLAFEPQVTAPNVLELICVAGREKWGSQPWEAETQAGLISNLERLAETMSQGDGGAPAVSARVDRRDYEDDPRLVIDLAGVEALEEVEVHHVSVSEGRLALSGRTQLDRLELEVGAEQVNDGLRALQSDPELRDLRQLLPVGSSIDVGHATPGRLTVSGRADLDWLPETRYRARVNLERHGPHTLTLTLEDVEIGGDTMDGFLRDTWVGGKVKRWVMQKLYAELDRQAAVMTDAYVAGDSNLRITSPPGSPQVRIIHLRPGTAGDVTVEPGFELESVAIEPGRIRIGARLSDSPRRLTSEPARPSGPPARGALGALGASGLDR